MTVDSLSDGQAYGLYVGALVWEILLKGSGGPAVLVLGASTTNSPRPSSSELSRAFSVALVWPLGSCVFKVLAVCMGLPSHDVWSFLGDIYSNQAENLGDKSYPVIGYVTSSTMAWVLWSSALIISLVAPMGVAAGIAALATRQFTGEVKRWALIAALPSVLFVAFKLRFQSLLCVLVADTTIVSYCIAAVVFTAVCEALGHKICELGVAAGAGAVYGALAMIAACPMIGISGCGTKKAIAVDLTEIRRVPAAVKLFSSKHQQGLDALSNRIRLSAEWKDEERNLGLHRDMHQVFWTRMIGTDVAVHYVLVINGHKYELCDMSASRTGIHYSTTPVHVEYGQLRPNYLAWLSNLAADDKRNTSSRRPVSMRLIGWTSLTHEQIDQICKELEQNWNYRITLWQRLRKERNCQRFVREIADKIMDADHKTINIISFYANAAGPIQIAEPEASFSNTWRPI